MGTLGIADVKMQHAGTGIAARGGASGQIGRRNGEGWVILAGLARAIGGNS